MTVASESASHAIWIAVGVLVAVRLAFVARRRSRGDRKREAATPTVGAAAATDGQTALAAPVETGVAGSAVLEVHNLTVAYGAKVAVDGVSFAIGRGEIFGLLGPNGAGKTSTLNAIEGLRRPRSGTVLLAGVDIVREPGLAKARMGVQLQTTGFQSELTVRQIARLYTGLYGIQMSDEELDRALEEIGLGRESDRTCKQISGGQQQRLSLFVALIHDPKLLLLDEPTTGLDPQSRRQLWTRIERIRSLGGSILLTTHSMEEAQAVCDRVAVIDHGRVLAIDGPRQLIERHRDDPLVKAASRGDVTLEDVFIGLTGSEVRD